MSRCTAHGFRIFFASAVVFYAFCRVQGNVCPKRWSYLAGYCYFFSNSTATWSNARQRCIETGADLVKVTSDEQNAFVASRYSSSRCLTEGTWIGLRRNPKNLSQWVWRDDFNVKPQYTKWHRKEPMNERLDKNCTEIHPSKSIYWYGRECSARGCYICVKDANECNNNNICSGQRCANVPGSYKCSCGTGYTATKEKRKCQDIDECKDENGGCPHFCVNTPGSYICHCRDGYVTENNGTVCRPPEFSTARTEIKSREETRITSTKDTNDTKLFTKPPAAKPPDPGIEPEKPSPLTKFGVLFTMAIPLCFIVCFLVLCYIKGPGKEKKEGGISGRLIESVSPFLDTAFMEPSEKNGKSKRSTGVSLSEEEPMV
ncbi:uncharacterized protein [Pocillopora verrucosa]|uniref:uncharacterized protein isoform X1 n=1 Tax=Pocillopora verrucosa TaxID=203993 RepID=UPI002796F706|nr:uncharacterized protein LOC131791182 isoform X1 [Pocillopora verrucosa]